MSLLRLWIILIALPCVLRSQEAVTTNFPQDAFLLLQSTNRVVETSATEPKPAPEKTGNQALRWLNRLPASTNQTIRLPEVAGIGTLKPPEATKGRNIDEVFEDIKVNDVLKEANELQRTGHNNDAVALLQSNLVTTVSVNARFRQYTQLGDLLFKLDDLRAAAEAYEEALNLKPGDASLANNLAAVYLTNGNVDKALETLGQVNTNLLSPADRGKVLYNINFNYACAFALKNKSEESITHLELASKYDPARTLGDMGDPQLDSLRLDGRFVQLRNDLEKRANPGR